jgi:hypothetical protein
MPRNISSLDIEKFTIGFQSLPRLAYLHPAPRLDAASSFSPLAPNSGKPEFGHL